MDRRIAIQFLDAREQIGLGRVGRQLELHRMQPEFPAHLVLRAHVGARSRIIADQNDRESGRDCPRFQRSRFRRAVRRKLFPHCSAVDQMWLAKQAILWRAVVAFDSFSVPPDSSTHPASARRSLARKLLRCPNASVESATRCGGPKMTRTVENGAGRMKRSQLFTRQQLEYSMLIGTTSAPDCCARKITPGRVHRPGRAVRPG